jgi:hypothetical protein
METRMDLQAPQGFAVGSNAGDLRGDKMDRILWKVEQDWEG